MKKYSFSIVSKITILVIGLVMITATLVGMVFYYGNNRFLLQNEFRNLARKTELLAPSLVNGINEGKRDLKFLIQTEDLLSYAIKDNKRKRKKLKTIFTEYLKAKNIQSITLIPYSKTFKALRVSKVPLERANFAPFKISEIERWQSVEEQKGGVSISGVSLRKISGEVVLPERPELHIAKELYLGDIRVGYLILTIDYGPNIKNLVNSVEQNYRVLIFNPDGDYLYGPDKKKNFGFDKGSRSLVQNDYRELGSFLTGRASTYSRFLEKKNREIIHVLKVPLEEKNPKSYLGLALITPHDKAVNAGVVVRRRS
ncbi:MAG: cache domain-containing protein, partial [Halobacteriovoraceae bacterium]|nr:cache domain-containing protein [Halobacteriovoraceae bacterium]